VANAQRLRRVADQIQRAVGMVTFTGVEVSPDFAHAKVFFTSLADPAGREATLAGLERAAGFLRSMLGARIKVHSTPALRFVYDESVEAGVRLSHLIDEAVASDVALARPARRRRAR
jgi:ribosome-binding factor A